MELFSIYSWSEVKMNRESLSGRASAYFQQCSSCQIQHFWHYLQYWSWRDLPSTHWGPIESWDWTINPCGLHHWPEWLKSPRMRLKEEIRSREDHRWDMDWTWVSSSDRNVRKPMWPNNSHKDAVLSKAHVWCIVSRCVSKHYPVSLTQGFD